MARSVMVLILGCGMFVGCGGASDTITKEDAPVNKTGTPETDSTQLEAQNQK